MKNQFLNIEQFKAITKDAQAEEMKRLALYIAENVLECTTEIYDLQTAYGKEMRKDAVSEKHQALQNVANDFGVKLLKAYRKRDIKPSIHKGCKKQAKETIKLVYELDVHSNVIITSKMLVKRVKLDKTSAELKLSKDGASKKKPAFKGGLIG